MQFTSDFQLHSFFSIFLTLDYLTRILFNSCTFCILFDPFFSFPIFFMLFNLSFMPGHYTFFLWCLFLLFLYHFHLLSYSATFSIYCFSSLLTLFTFSLNSFLFLCKDSFSISISIALM